ncbi:uncharacterized protein LOC143921430 [Arctopsyche grandis]|uniref:uncharacterized protein LOC143921430 n=1 Tax=Arctopsyche grandis TaxID=121162 RepID=UPI00406D77BE
MDGYFEYISGRIRVVYNYVSNFFGPPEPIDAPSTVGNLILFGTWLRDAATSPLWNQFGIPTIALNLIGSVRSYLSANNNNRGVLNAELYQPVEMEPRRQNVTKTGLIPAPYGSVPGPSSPNPVSMDLLLAEIKGVKMDLALLRSMSDDIKPLKSSGVYWVCARCAAHTRENQRPHKVVF